MKIFTRFFLMLLFVAPLAQAQDWHYSQFYYSPLTLNPALTGNMDGTYRIGLNYTNQWAAITSPFVYSTPSIWADVTVFRGKYSGNSLGMGLYVMDDKAGDGRLSTLNVMYSLAYHQTIDATGNFHISAGIQGGIMQRRIDQSKLYFANQFTGSGFDNNILSNENIEPTHLNADIAAGGAFSGMLSDYSRISFGFAVLHLARPQDSFEGDDWRYYMSYNAHAEGTFGLQNKVYLFPAAYYHIQGPETEVEAGTAIGYNFSPNKRKVGTIFYVGGFYRLNDAAVATAGFLLKGLQCGLSYDITTSSLNTANAGNGAFEIALKYGNTVVKHKMKKAYCPRF